MSGDIDLAHVNWGNYDLVVIDESHNFRNKRHATKGRRDSLRPPDAEDHQGGRQDPRAHALRHAGQQPPGRPAQPDRLSPPRATTRRLLDHGIGSIDSTTRLAQKQFNRWLDLDDAERTPVAPHRDARLRLLHPARPADHRPLAQAHREVLRHRRDRPLPGPPEADQHQGRRGPRRRVPLDPRHQQRDPPAQPRRLRAAALRAAAQAGRLRRKSTARRFAAARASSARSTARKA